MEYPSSQNTSETSLEERFRGIDKKVFKIDIYNHKCYNPLFVVVEKILEVDDYQPLTIKRITDLCEILTNKIGKDSPINKQLWEYMHTKSFKPTSFNAWFERMREEMRRLHSAIKCLETYGLKTNVENMATTTSTSKVEIKKPFKSNGSHHENNESKNKS